MLKRTLTAIVLLVLVAGFMVCGYFVSPIFIDMLILLFLAGAVYEMYKCFKDAGYKMFVVPIVFMLVTAYPVFYTMQHFAGIGVQGLLIVLLVSSMLALTILPSNPQNTEKKTLKTHSKTVKFYKTNKARAVLKICLPIYSCLCIRCFSL